MVRTLVTGGTGILGSALRPRLQAAGHDVRATSRSPDAARESPPRNGGSTAGDRSVDGVEWVALDLTTGSGVERAVADVDVVIHTATNATGNAEAVDVHGTERLLDAAAAAGVDHVVYPSIVGIDDVPFSYYQHKRAAEDLVEASSVPSTIVRATQFHQFLDRLLAGFRWLPVWPLPTDFRSQPVDVRHVADELVALADGEPKGRTGQICGPEAMRVREIATAYRDARGYRRPIVRLPIPGEAARAFREGYATLPAAASDTSTWREYLSETYGDRPRREARVTATSR